MQALPLMEVEAITAARTRSALSSSGSGPDESNRVTTISPREGVGTLVAPRDRAHWTPADKAGWSMFFVTSRARDDCSKKEKSRRSKGRSRAHTVCWGASRPRGRRAKEDIDFLILSSFEATGHKRFPLCPPPTMKEKTQTNV